MREGIATRILGAAVLGVAVVLIAVAAVTLVGVVRDPSAHFQALRHSFTVTSHGPSASFDWSSQGYNLTVTDTSTDNGSTIVRWVWDFGDGTGFVGRSPPVHTYSVACPSCTENVSLGVTDAAGANSAASTNVQIQRFGAANGSALSPTPANKVPQIGGGLLAAPGAVELFLLMFLIAGSVAHAGYRLLLRPLESVSARVRPRANRP